MDFQNISIDETQAAALLCVSVDTLRRRRRLGIDVPKHFTLPGNNRPRYFLHQIMAVRDAKEPEVA
ncbi:MAG: hypothetical protein WA322_01440 [Pseudolabrys sp.]